MLRPAARELERCFQTELRKALKRQGFYFAKVTERYMAGRPDIRIGRIDTGQLDVELKVIETALRGKPVATGIERLQRIKMIEMNNHGMPAVGLVYHLPSDAAFVTILLRDDFTDTRRCVLKGDGGDVISGVSLFETAREYLNSDRYRIDSGKPQRPVR